MPVLAQLDEDVNANGFLLGMIADKAGVAVDDVLDFDMSLYDTTPAALVGANSDFLTSGRLDDLSMCMPLLPPCWRPNHQK